MKKNLIIFEFFGLPKAGKSFYRDRLIPSNKNIKNYKSFKEPSDFFKFFYFLKFFILNPIRTFYLFYILVKRGVYLSSSPWISFKAFFMRISYLIGSLSKSEIIKNLEGRVLVEDFTTQALFMIFHQKAKKRELLKVLEILPKPDYLCLFEVEKETRWKRLEEITFLDRVISRNYSEQWMKNSDENYTLIKGILIDQFKEDSKMRGELQLKPKKSFSLKKVLKIK